MPTNLKNRLLPDLSKAAELELYLTMHFGTSVQKVPREVEYGNSVIVKYYKSMNIEAIYVSEIYDEQAIAQLQADIAEALATDRGTEVNRIFLHSPCPTEGYFRHGDTFQILPPPSTAPQPDQMIGDYSFVLEYSFQKSPDMRINVYRCHKKQWEISLLLNALLRHGLKLPNRSVTKEWALVTHEIPLVSRYQQLGYFSPDEDGRAKDPSGFTSVAEYEQLQMLDTHDYYSKAGIAINDSQTIPTNLQQSLEAFDGLDDAEKEKFLRASYWSHVASRVFATSGTAAFIALVNAIEVFLPDSSERCKTCGRSTSSESCPTCNQPSAAGPTKHFRDFLEEHSPGVPEASRKKLYEMRSKFTHGASLMPGDLDDIVFRFSADKNEACDNWRQLKTIVQVVFVNWLNSQQ